MPIAALIAFFLGLQTGCSSSGNSTIRFHPGDGGEPGATLREEPLVPLCATLGAPASSTSTLPMGQHQVVISWKASVPASNEPFDQVAGYCLYRSTNPLDAAPQLVNLHPFSGTSCSDRGVASGLTYTYWVAAISSGNKPSRLSKSNVASIPNGPGPHPVALNTAPPCGS